MMVITPKHGVVVIVTYILIFPKNNSLVHQLSIKNADSSRIHGTNVKIMDIIVVVADFV